MREGLSGEGAHEQGERSWRAHAVLCFPGPASQVWECHVKRPPSGVCGEQQESSWTLLSTCEGVRRRGCQQLAQTSPLI